MDAEHLKTFTIFIFSYKFINKIIMLNLNYLFVFNCNGILQCLEYEMKLMEHVHHFQ